MSIPLPEYHNHEEFQNRLRKLQEIKKLNIDPYPYKYNTTTTTKALLEEFEGKEASHDDAKAGSTKTVTVAGRLVLFRAMGKNAFAQLQDDTGRMQIMFNRDVTTINGYTPDETSIRPIKFIEKMLDLGDIIGIEGNVFRTQKGELTIFAKEVTLLCKPLLPLPDKHSGLADKGTRYRKRWLDLITSTTSTSKFILRSNIVKFIRDYFSSQGFMEVETSVLQNTYGGAQAKPFVTHLNALKQDMFLRISLEIPLKMLLVGGIPRVFEIGKVFRNEDIDRTHNPEFTELEAYAAYWDYNDLMQLTENLFEALALKLFGTTSLAITTKDDTTTMIDVKAPWKKLTLKDSIKEYANIDVDTMSDKELYDLLLAKTHLDKDKLDNKARGSLIAYVFEEFAESHLIQPHHIIDHPIETTPLCKLHRNEKEKKERIVERFESFILGGEITNAYSELNDPVLQRELLLQQAQLKKDGDEEANPLDEEFIEAICQGMPPAAGIGMGIDRLVMLFANAASIRDVIFFPLMKPEDQ
jgi:lysyl-tRNA synthetase, class II